MTKKFLFYSYILLLFIFPGCLKKSWDNKKEISVISSSMGVPNTFVTMELSKFKTNAKILDQGSGDCRHLLYAASKGYLNLFGIDISKEENLKCKKGFKAANLTPPKLYLGDTRLFYKENYFDLIINTKLLGLLDREGGYRTLENLIKSLKPNGEFILVTFGTNMPYKERQNWHIVTLFSLEELKKFFLSKGIEIISAFEWPPNDVVFIGKK